MRVYRKDGEKEWHLVVTTRWEPGGFEALHTFMVQRLCDIRAWPVARKFELEEYVRASHGKKLCEKCKEKAMKSKRTGPQV